MSNYGKCLIVKVRNLIQFLLFLSLLIKKTSKFYVVFIVIVLFLLVSLINFLFLTAFFPAVTFWLLASCFLGWGLQSGS